MKTSKKLLCVVLVVLMCVSLIPGSVFAAPDKTGTITVTVKDTLTDKPVNGASIRLDVLDNNEVKGSTTKKTGSDGTATWSDLSSGWYRIVEESVPDGYVLNTNAIVDYYDFNKNDKPKVEIKNRVTNTLYVFRVDETTGNGLSGASYEVKDGSNQTVASGSTDKNGMLLIPHMPAGTFTICETKTPADHTSKQKTQSVTIPANSAAPTVAVFSDASGSSIVIFNYDMATGKPIQGSTWKIDNTDGDTDVDSASANESGIVVVPNVTAGSYDISELTVADGYKAELVTKSVTIGSDPETSVLVASNKKPGKVTIFVGDYRDGAAVEGTLCELQSLKGETVAGPAQTKDNGTVTFEDVEDGQYVLKIVPPSTFKVALALDKLTVYGGGDYSASVPVTGRGSIEIYAYDASTKAELSGATLTVKKTDGSKIGDFTTDEHGKVTVPGLKAGIYTVTETTAPKGYIVNPETYSVVVKLGETSEVNVPHYTTPHVLVHCYVKGTVTPIAGSVVTLVNERTSTSVEGTVGEDGSFIFDKLEAGNYVVKYTSAPDDYNIYTVSQKVTVTATESPSVVLYATRSSSITIHNVDEETGSALPGAVFSVKDATGKIVDVVTADMKGCAVTKPLAPGNYTVFEVTASDGYVPTVAYQTVTISENSQPELTFLNKKASSIVVYAYTNTEVAVPGVTYILYDAITDEEVASAVTNAAGVAVFDDVEPGIYTVVESVIPEGYMVVNPTQTNIRVLSGDPVYLRYVHVPLSTITIQTVDTLTGEGIPGAEYLIVSEDGSFRKNYTADENGEIVTESLAIGTYYVKQVVAPKGYLLNTTTQTITVYRDDSALAKFFNDPMSGITVECLVTGANFGIPGVVVTIENEAGKEIARGTTNEEGIFSLTELDPGAYTVKVVSMPNGYECIQKERTITVTTGTSSSVKFEFTGDNRLIVNLTDKDDPSKGLAGSKFRVEAVNGNFVIDIVTDASGKAKTGALPNGTYTVHQIEAPEGYLLDQSYQWVEIDETANCVLDFTNSRISGLELRALDEDGYGISGVKFEVWTLNEKLVTTVVTDKTGVATVGSLAPDTYLVKEISTPGSYTALTLTQNCTITTGRYTTLTFYHTEKAYVTIKATEAVSGNPIYGATFVITTANGSYVGEYTTNKSGVVSVSRLSAGTYNIYQSNVPDGYVIDSLSRTFTVVDGEPTMIHYVNELLSGICVRFYDAETSAPIYGVVMEVRDKNNNYIGRFTSNNLGEVDLTDVLSAGRYVLAILSVPTPYEMDNVPKTIDVASGNTTTVRWALNKTPGQLTITTYSGEDNPMMNVRKNSTLPGAIYNIYNASGILVRTIVSDGTGNAYSGMLSAGTYYVQQMAAPMGWQVNAVRFAVNISANNDNVRVEVYNKAANYETYVRANGPASITAGEDATFYYVVENKSTCAMDNFFLHIKVPTDVMRTYTFHTGTFSGAATTYYVEYKTNMNDYRQLATGLNSKSNYGYDLSSQSLGLQAGEYVTDIRMVFAKAVSGFTQSMAPTLSCYVLTTVIGNTQATMRAEVGGMAGSYSDASNGGQFGSNTGSGTTTPSGWTTGSSEFTVWVIGCPQNELPDTLPKTGF